MIKKLVVILVISVFMLSMSYAEEKVLRVDSKSRPLLIKKVNPVYPKKAVEKRISGNVLLTATTDIYGRVEAVEVVEAPDDLLAEAAVKALKQWVYKPYLVNKKPKRVKFTVNVTFALDKKRGGCCAKSGRKVMTLKGGSAPELIKRVAPSYPPEALKKGIVGDVVVEAVSDTEGRVRSLQVTKSPDKLLSTAAIAAVKKWKYKPYIVDGEAVPVKFSVVVTFSLN